MVIRKISLIGLLAALAVSVFAVFLLINPPSNKIKAFIAKTFLGQPDTATYKNIIFDLNGVLFEISKTKALAHLGVADTISYTLSGKKPDDLQNKIFDVLATLDQKQLTKSVNTNDLIPTHNTRVLPKIFCDWMKGTVSTQEITELTQQKLAVLPDSFYSSKLEKRLIHKLASMMFSPKLRCAMYKPITHNIKLLKQCKKLGLKTYLLSNMDTYLIELLQTEHPEIFELFDGMVISADVNMIKPYTNIYAYTLHRFDLKPSETCFIDDELMNINGAKQSGIKALQFNQAKPKQVNKQLIALGVLPAKNNRTKDLLKYA